MHKCHKCVFKDVFRDQDENIPICRRCEGLQNAIAAYNYEGPCQWHISWQQLMDMQEKLAVETQYNPLNSQPSGWSGNMWDA